MPTPLIKPTMLPCPWAQNGDKNVIPESGADLGYASWAMGWGVINQMPLEAGGIPPQRTDFNGALNALSSHLFWLQSGGMYEWSASFDYPLKALIWGSDGELYLSLQPSGPGTEAGVKDPTAESSAAYWRKLDTSGKPQSAGYELCEFYPFRHPTLRPGFQTAYGGLLQGADTLYPDAWEYLQSEEGQVLCLTEAEWQAMSTAAWHTNADGTKVGWQGIGGVPFYVLDTTAKTLRLPDLRGMYAEMAGFDALTPGGVHGDGIREISGGFPAMYGADGNAPCYGCFVAQKQSDEGQYVTNPNNTNQVYSLNTSRVVPVAPTVRPRAYGVLPTVYLGKATS